MKRAAAYIRVSTSDQLEYSPDSQRRLIQEYAQRNRMILNSLHIFQDDGISGRDADKRPAFQQMIAMAKGTPAPFDVILVYSTSRFARNHEQSVVYRAMLERECGVEVVSITQPSVDKKTDMLTTAIYAIMDEWYSLDLSDNVRRGMTQRALAGGHQSSPPLGYEQKYPGAPISVKPEEAVIIRYIFEQFSKGASKWRIAKRLSEAGMLTKKGNAIDTRAITYILRNPVYKGYSRWTPTHRVYWDFKNEDTIITKAAHEAIIPESLFDAVQLLLDQAEAVGAKKARPTETTKHWLSGIIKCAGCGASLNYNGASATRKHPFFECGRYGKGACGDANFITVTSAEESLLAYLRELTEGIDIAYMINPDTVADNAQTLAGIEKEIRRLNGKLARAKQGFLNGIFTLDEFIKLEMAVSGQIAIAQSQKEELGNPQSACNALQKEVKNIYDILIQPEFEKNEKQTALRSIVRKIVFDKKSGEFRIHFFR